MTKYTTKIIKIFFAVFAVSVAVLVPVRTWVLLHSVDPATGFYYDSAPMVGALNIGLIVFTVALLVPFLMKRAGKLGTGTFNNAPVTAILAFILAVSLIADFADKMSNIISFKTMSAGVFLTGLTAVFAGISFFVLGRAMMGKNLNLNAVSLVPVLWGVVNLVSTFMNLTTIANISEYLYEVLQMVFCMIFLYYHARIISGMENRTEINGAVAFGLPCALFGLLASVPRIIVHLISAHKGSFPGVDGLVLIVFSVYVVSFLAHILIRNGEEQLKETVPTAE